MAEGSSNFTKQLKVIKKSPKLISYMNKSNGREMTYFNLIGAEGPNMFHLRVYNKSKFEMIEPGCSYKFTNIIQKSEDEYWVTSQSLLAYTTVVESEDFGDATLPEERPPDGQQKTIAEALKSPEKSTISGIIVKASPTKYRQDQTLAVKALLMKDKETVAKVCLFGQNAEGQYAEGNMLKVTGVYPKKYYSKVQLTCSPVSKCEFLPVDPSIKIAPEDALAADDPDFDEAVDTTVTEPMTLTDFTYVDIYDCCKVEACRMKKMINGKCPVCGGEQSRKTYRVHFLLSTPKVKDKKVTLFQTTIENLCKKEMSTESKPAMIQELIHSLPIKINAVLNHDKLLNISAR